MKIFFKKIKLINKYFKLFLISISLILFIIFICFFKIQIINSDLYVENQEIKFDDSKRNEIKEIKKLDFEEEYLGIKFKDKIKDHFLKSINLNFEKDFDDDGNFNKNKWETMKKDQQKKINNYWIKEEFKKFKETFNKFNWKKRKEFQELYDDQKKNLIQLAFKEKYFIIKFYNLKKFFNNNGEFKKEFLKKINSEFDRKNYKTFESLKQLFEKDEFSSEIKFKVKEKEIKYNQISKILIYTFSFILFFSLVSFFIYKKISKKFTKKTKNNEN